MGKLVVKYRLPSTVVLQLETLPDLRLTLEGLTVVIKEPALDPVVSSPPLWSAFKAHPSYRYGDVLVVEVGLTIPLETEDSLSPHSERMRLSQTVLQTLQPVLERLLLLIQVVGRQHWVGHLTFPLSWVRHPLRYRLLDDDGQDCGFGSGGLGEPLIDRDFWLTSKKWLAIGELLRRSEDPPLPRMLLQEAWGFWEAGNLRSAALSGAMACEVAIKTFIHDVPGAQQPIYRYMVERDRGLSIFNFLDDVLTLATGTKPKDALTYRVRPDTSAYSLLRHLFEVRNKVAHEGRAYRRVGSREQPTGTEDIQAYLTAASGLLSWLENLRAAAEDDLSEHPTP